MTVPKKSRPAQPATPPAESEIARVAREIADLQQIEADTEQATNVLDNTGRRGTNERANFRNVMREAMRRRGVLENYLLMQVPRDMNDMADLLTVALDRLGGMSVDVPEERESFEHALRVCLLHLIKQGNHGRLSFAYRSSEQDWPTASARAVAEARPLATFIAARVANLENRNGNATVT